MIKNAVTLVLCLVVLVIQMQGQVSRNGALGSIKKPEPNPKKSTSKPKKPSTTKSTAKPSSKANAAQEAKLKAENEKLLEDVKKGEEEAKAEQARAREAWSQKAIKELEVLKAARLERKRLRAQGMTFPVDERLDESIALKREVELMTGLELTPVKLEIEELRNQLDNIKRRIVSLENELERVRSYVPSSLPGGTRLQPTESRESRELQQKGAERLHKTRELYAKALGETSRKLNDAEERLSKKKREIERELDVEIP